MQSITFTTPYPPSNNSLYTISKNKTWSEDKEKYYNKRVLTNKARCFKKYVSELIAYTHPKIKYGRELVEVHILVNPPKDNRRRDIHNGEKALFDAIKASGIIEDDDQIVHRTSTIGDKMDGGQWIVTMKLYQKEIINEKLDKIDNRVCSLCKHHLFR